MVLVTISALKWSKKHWFSINLLDSNVDFKIPDRAQHIKCQYIGGPVGPADHLEDVSDGRVVVGVQLAVVVLAVHQSEMTRMKYCGGIGSNTRTNNLMVCSSSQNFCLRRKNLLWRIISLFPSSRRIQNASLCPWTFSSQWKSGVRVSSIRSVDLDVADQL